MKFAMNINPMYRDEMNKRHWTVSVFRIFGVIQLIFGGLAAYAYVKPVLLRELVGLNINYDLALIISVALGVIVGIATGMFLSAATFAFAMLFEDIHAMRIAVTELQANGQTQDE